MHKKMWIAGISLAAVLLLPACGAASSGGTAAPAGGSARVEMQGMKFIPAILTIKAGTTVTWENMDFVQHDVHSDNETFKSAMISGGQTYQFAFRTAGTFRYYCDAHGGPGGKGMSGVVEVTP